MLKKLLKIAARAEEIAARAEEIKERLAEHALYTNALSKRLDKLSRNHGMIASDRTHPTPPEGLTKVSEGLQLFLDKFYNQLENRYRGSTEDITTRLSLYLPDVEAAYFRTDKKPVMDLGCGRGEWLGLLRDFGIEATGVDINDIQLSSARENNLNAFHKDAFEALEEADTDSLSVISAYHFIEHISFPQLSWIVLEAQRVLAPGGLLILETPNPANLIVGANTFYIDPTHKHPLPSQLLETLFNSVGFTKIEIRNLHPGGDFDRMLSEPSVNPKIAQLLFGPQDLAILGRKPG